MKMKGMKGGSHTRNRATRSTKRRMKKRMPMMGKRR